MAVHRITQLFCFLTLSPERDTQTGAHYAAARRAFLAPLCRFSLRGLAIALAASILLVPMLSVGQTGFPPFNSFQHNGLDSINEGTLNVHAEWVITRSEGVGLPFEFRITFDGGSGAVWFKTTDRFGNVKWAGGQNGWNTNWEDPIGFISTTGGNISGSCETYTTSYHDGHNTWHKFSSLVLAATSGTALCPTPTTSGGALDGSGYIITDTNVDGETGGYNPTITDKYGNKITGGQQWNGNYLTSKITDPNGNAITETITYNPSAVTDTYSYVGTLGNTVLSYTPPATQSTTTYNFTGGNGPASASIHYSTIPYATAFSCIPNVSGSKNLPDSLTLADASTYTFQYDSQGFLHQINLPQGGYIQYNYTETVDCTAGTATLTGLTRTAYDNVSNTSGTTTYTQTGTQANSTTTVTAPSGDKQVITFQNYSEVDRKIYSGSSTLLKEVVHCFNYTSAAPCTTQTGVNSTGTPPKALSALTYLSGSTSGANTVMFYGNTAPYVSGTQLDVPTETDTYDFGAITPTQRVFTPTGSWNGSGACVAIGNNILNHTCYININDSGSGLYSSTTSTYDSKGNLTAISRNTGTIWLTTQYFYDTNGTISKIIDPNGTYRTFTNKTCGPVPYAFPQSIQTYTSAGTLLPYPSFAMTYDPNCNTGQPFTATDANGQKTTYTRNDPFWRLTAMTDPLGNTTSYTYTPTTSESVLNFNNGASTIDTLTTVDGLARVKTVQKRQGPGSANFGTVSRTYDANGRPATVSIPCTAATGGTCSTTAQSFSYDGLNRVTQIQNPATTGYVSYSYSGQDVLQTLGPAPTGENPKKRQYEYDGLGRLTSVCELTSASGSGTCAQATTQTGYWTKYTLDTLGRLTNVNQNAQGTAQTRTYAYDWLSRMTYESNPESGAVNYYYDSASGCTTYSGALVKRTDPNGNTICYGYDSLARNTSITYSGPNATSHNKYFVYDSATVHGFGMSYAAGRLAEAYTADTSAGTKFVDEGFSYDQDGGMVTLYESTPHSGGWYGTSSNYFANGAASSLSGIPGNSSLTFNVDGEGRPYSAVWNTPTPTNLVTSVAYNAADQVTNITMGFGDKDDYSYNANTGMPTNYTFTVGGTPKTDSGTLTWNANGTLNQLSITDQFNSPDTQTCTYGYDDLARTGSVTCGTTWQQAFTYDPFGNITKSGSLAWNPGYSTSPSNNHYTLAGTSYDSNGNLLTDTFHTYTWDASNKMLSADTHTVTYDAFGRVVEFYNGSAYREYLYSPIGQVAEMSGQTVNGTTGVRFTLPGGLGLQASTNAGTTYFHHKDWLGSARLISTRGGRASYFDTAFAPFGENYVPLGTTDLDFTGKVQDVISGTYDFPARESNPNQGRWISPDPAGLDAVDPSNPQTWNRYAYVGNNPTGAVDSLGLFSDMNDAVQYLRGLARTAALFSSFEFFVNVEPTIVGFMNVGNCDNCSIPIFDLNVSLVGAAETSDVGGGGVPANNGNPIVPANPCNRAGGAPDPSVYQAKGQAAQTNAIKDLYYLFQFRAGGGLDAQPQGASPAYANYAYGAYMSAAGYTLNQALAGADIYAQYRGSYPNNPPMDFPNHPFTPVVNVMNITYGFDAQQNGTLCHK